ncbi:hypothetical protein B0I35DRAFT_460342 [Stachybotrys elegans]|uniref:Autophagy-related protein 6 n=1 Tax=Stachybotrys elegans TaxID=80388 RepID=A0A8K0SRL9_9HYPO|nr:hypothetical protein B0I35DRAFT_460342 [Stachybotrys elegans]
MGWLSSIWGTDKNGDPLGKLDPKLREFLEKESPVKYTASQPSPPTPVPTSPPAPDTQKTAAEPAPAKPAVPSESLYQDGRYAHLWSTYKPLSQIESENATDSDRLQSVLDAFKARKAAIGRASMENCALEQEEWVNCMKNGSWEDQLQMCKYQVRRFERCYTMQSRFLRALGYASVQGRPVEIDDDIQMHSDSLYQRMLAHEAAVEKAKQEGAPIPQFELKIPQVKAVKPSEEQERSWKEALDKLPETERAAEEAALRADLAVNIDAAQDIKKFREEKEKEREQRRAEGKATWGDNMSAWWFGGSK